MWPFSKPESVDPIVFHVNASQAQGDWRKAERTWRCEVLRIPSGTVEQVRKGDGTLVEPQTYTPKRLLGAIEWHGEGPVPEEIVIRISVAQRLITATDAATSAKGAALQVAALGLIATVAGASISGYSSYQSALASHAVTPTPPASPTIPVDASISSTTPTTSSVVSPTASSSDTSPSTPPPPWTMKPIGIRQEDLSPGQKIVVPMPKVPPGGDRYTIRVDTSLACSRSACSPPTGPGADCYCNTPASAKVVVNADNKEYPLEYKNETPTGYIGTTNFLYQRSLTVTTEKLLHSGDVIITVVSTGYVQPSLPLRINGEITILKP
jgi:hypothetical protein